MTLFICNEIVYDIIVLAILALFRNYDIIYDIIKFGMISYMISYKLPYVPVLISRSTFKLGLVGASSRCQLRFRG